MMELLNKQFKVDKNHFQQVIDVGNCYVSSTSHFLLGLHLFLFVSQKKFMKNSVSPKNTVYLINHQSAHSKIANFT